MHFSHYKALLRLSDDAMEMADRHAVDEKKLRYVAALPTEMQSELMQQIIALKLSSKQIQEICNAEEKTEDEQTEHISAKALKVARVLQSVAATSPKDVARALLQQEQNVTLAHARFQTMRQLLDDTDRFLEEE